MFRRGQSPAPPGRVEEDHPPPGHRPGRGTTEDAAWEHTVTRGTTGWETRSSQPHDITGRETQHPARRGRRHLRPGRS
jgi:hypothetical protein